jgi:hypothetical protein
MQEPVKMFDFVVSDDTGYSIDKDGIARTCYHVMDKLKDKRPSERSINMLSVIGDVSSNLSDGELEMLLRHMIKGNHDYLTRELNGSLSICAENMHSLYPAGLHLFMTKEKEKYDVVQFLFFEYGRRLGHFMLAPSAVSLRKAAETKFKIFCAINEYQDCGKSDCLAPYLKKQSEDGFRLSNYVHERRI